ncbi:phage protease [Caldimonas sp. KR1-144]|uniref:phage protease n=1 Tax=Caldimonas sp. KR1-144 TaxID=3400911 RepID=UPI003C0D1AE1
MHRRTALTAAVGLALAACAFELPALEGGSHVIELQFVPAGAFRPSDGREMPVDAWRIDAASASRVIERFRQRKTPPVIDYEHQTLNKEANGQPAPAAAFIKDLVWREGRGLFAVAELTQRASDLIGAKEYRYFSPVFTFDKQTGTVLEVLMGALTNSPAIDGMEPLALRAAATFGIASTQEDHSMNKLLAAMIAAFGLEQTATEDQAIAALTAIGPIKDLSASLASVRKALELDDKADGAALVAACTQLKAASADPAKFAPVSVVTQLQGQVATLTARLQEDEVTKLIEPALADGRLLAGEQEAWARELGKKDIAALTSFLKTAQPIAALGGTQTKGKKPEGGADGALSADELAVCSRMGLTVEQFKAGATAQA